MSNKYMPRDMVDNGFKFCIICRKVFVDETRKQDKVKCGNEECKRTYYRVCAHFKRKIDEGEKNGRTTE